LGRIIQLDKHVADLIAAGEVVERPASAVKELAENSVDAGATGITVEIKRGGLEMIRVTDNGGGISPEDVPAAFLRHATSKIRSERDLEEIRSMGFRGEALASIAAVSKIEMFTRQAGRTEGVSYELHGGEEVSRSPAGCPVGTTVIVRELFYNTPARMKFIKRDVTEAGQAASVVRRLALANPGISFKLIKDGETVLHTPGDGLLKSAVYSVCGGTFTSGLEETRAEHEGIRVYGFVSKPLYGQGNRTKQEFFVNGRPVKSPLLGAALEEAYKNSIMQNRFPACVLHVEISPAVVDVNVHPAKTEIKFAYDRSAFDAVYLAAKSAVSGGDSAAELTFSPSPKSDFQESYEQARLVRAPAGNSAGGTADRKSGGGSGNGGFYKEMSAPEFRSDGALPGVVGDSAFSPALNQVSFGGYKTGDIPLVEEWRILGEAFSTYIIVEDGDDLCFIDKHAAHERIIFERLKEEAAKPVSQVLIKPVIFTPERGELTALLNDMELLCDMGFDAEEFGGGSIIVRALPGDLDGADAEASLQEIARLLTENRRMSVQDKRDGTLSLVACKAAMKAGSIISYAEQRALVERVLRIGDIKYCPHGRPVLSVMKKSELERKFGRIQ
jgi:DNA mismatch repair protein MutL